MLESEAIQQAPQMHAEVNEMHADAAKVKAEADMVFVFNMLYVVEIFS